MASSTTTTDAVYTELKQLYHNYRHTELITSKRYFFSPTCMQVCRSRPNFAAREREKIVLYLAQAFGFDDVESYERAHSSHSGKDTQPPRAGDNAGEEELGKEDGKVKALKDKGYYSIRLLKSAEASEVLAEEVVAPLAMTPSQLETLKQKEQWIGMRVDLWEDGDGDSKGRLIRVNYWWRKEEADGEQKWLQCLHDIISIGERDGTEGLEGDVLE